MDDRLIQIYDEDQAFLCQELDAGFEGDLVCLLEALVSTGDNGCIMCLHRMKP